MRWIALLGTLVVTASGASCMHVKGVVLEERTQGPMRTAVITVGRPNGIAVYDSHQVDKNGAFDFYVLPTDEDNLYLYDGAGMPELTMERIDRMRVGDKMKLYLRPAPKDMQPGMEMRHPIP